jgi:hypothetical protein
MRRYALLALTGSLLGYPIHMLAQQDLDIGMKMTKTAVMLGEPVWIDITVTNRSGRPINLDFGSACWGNKPLKVWLPDAESAVNPAARCSGGFVGSCLSGALPALADGGTMTRSYVLEGDFHIVRPGSYEVLLEKTIRYAPVSSNRSDLPLTASLEKQQTARSTVVLQVDAADSAKLLALEQAYARTAMEKPAEPEFPASSPDGKPMDITAVRLASDRLYSDQMEASLLHYAIVEGLSVYPVAGMEPVFRNWVESDQYNAYGLMALKRLNTPAAREALADIASSQTSFRWQAVDALADLGDKTYLSLLVQLLASPNEPVRRAAIQGVGKLGGDAAVPVLLEEIRTAPNIERNDAMTALGDTKSRAAVKVLIDLTGGSGSDYQNTWWPLFVLTHHRLPTVTYRRTAEQTHDAWQRWWNTGGKDAPVYSPYRCASKEKQ